MDIFQYQRISTTKRYKENESLTKFNYVSTEKVKSIGIQGKFAHWGIIIVHISFQFNQVKIFILEQIFLYGTKFFRLE